MLSSGSSGILGVLSEVNIQANTANGIIQEFCRMLPILTKAYSGVVSNLSKIIDEKTACSINFAMTDLECACSKYLTEFLQEDERGMRKEVDYEPVTKRAEKFKKAITNAVDSKKCVNTEAQDASKVLNLVLDHLMICYHGLDICSQAILYEQKCKEPSVLKYFITVGTKSTKLFDLLIQIFFPLKICNAETATTK